MNMGNRMYGIVYTSGTFDLFHRNHLELIKRAKSLADYLIVGVSSDELVCQYKNSPSIPFEERIEIIEAIKYVDCTIPQYSLNHIELVKKLNIECFVVGDDWYGKYDYLKEYCDVKYFPYGKGVSTSKLRERIVRSYAQLRDSVDQHDNPNPKNL